MDTGENFSATVKQSSCAIVDMCFEKKKHMYAGTRGDLIRLPIVLLLRTITRRLGEMLRIYCEMCTLIMVQLQITVHSTGETLQRL